MVVQNQTQIETPKSGEVQTQTQVQEKRYLVRLVRGHDFNLHLWDTEKRQQLIVRMANEYVLLSKLIDYLMENGHKRYYYSYYQRKQATYANPAWEMRLTAEQIMSLLNINKRNMKCGTLIKIKQFLGLPLYE